MIGQERLVNHFTTVSPEDCPPFIILTGKKGSGKKSLASILAPRLGKYVVHMGVSVANIREMIDTAYQVKDKAVFIIDDADNMSLIAKNALLKICEEPPNNVHVIMTMTDVLNTLPTIRSRATVFTMDSYLEEELEDFYWKCTEILNKNESDLAILKKYCETPGEMIEMSKIDVNKFSNFVDSVIDNVLDITLANALKISTYLAINDEQDKYPLDMFLKVFSIKCIGRYKDNPIMYGKATQISSKYLADVPIVAFSKQSIFDAWLISIKEVWLDYAKSNS